MNSELYQGNIDVRTSFTSNSVYNILNEANKLGLLVEGVETSLAYNKITNEAITVVNCLSWESLNYQYKARNNPRALTIQQMNRETRITVHNLSNILEVLIKLEIVQSNNGYYSLIPL